MYCCSSLSLSRCNVTPLIRTCTKHCRTSQVLKEQRRGLGLSTLYTTIAKSTISAYTHTLTQTHTQTCNCPLPEPTPNQPPTQAPTIIHNSCAFFYLDKSFQLFASRSQLLLQLVNLGVTAPLIDPAFRSNPLLFLHL